MLCMLDTIAAKRGGCALGHVCREQGHTLTAASCSFDFRIMAPCQLPFSICAECMCRAGPSGQRESQQPCVGHALMYSMHARWTNAAQAWAF